MKDNLYTSEEAREKLMSGVRRASNAIAITMGTAGYNSILEDIRNPGYLVSNDGASILERIRFADPLEEMGRRILLEAVGRSNKANGDGSSTATLLTASILEEGIKHLGGSSPMDMKRSLEACLPLIEESLKSQRKELVDKEGNIDFKLLEQAATISAEDESIGKLITEIYKQIGKDGVINWEPSKTIWDSYSIGTGIKMEGATYASRYMCDSEGSGFSYQATIENPLVLLAYTKITNHTELDKLMGELVDAQVKDLVVFCNEMDTPVLNSFILARAPQNLGIRFLVIKVPTVFNDLWWEDLEKASGGRMVSPASGIRLKELGMNLLGRFGKITVTREDTFIDGIQDISKHILALKVDNTEDSLARAARLNTRTAIYYVGGHSDSSLAYRRLKVEDAVNSAWCAMQNGILPGGGVALRNAAIEVSRPKNNLEAEDLPNVSQRILAQALQMPFRTILSNASIDDASGKKHTVYEKETGWNTKNQKLVNMFEAGIVDSYDVVLGAVKSAIGVASGILTCGTVVLLPRNEDSIGEAIKNMVQMPIQQ